MVVDVQTEALGLSAPEVESLVTVPLIALLLQLRLAFTALAAIAISLTAATLVIDLLGYSFNALVTLGLLLALAIVVADAAGDAHSLMTRLGEQPGQPAARLVPAVCGEFRGALASAALAILLSVAPLYFATGLTASFLRPMVLAFGLAVAVSMVIAVTVTPALAVLLLGAGWRRSRGAQLRRRLQAAYLRSLEWVVRVPRFALLALGVAAGVAALALPPLLHPGPPQFQDRNLVVRWTGAPGMSLTEIAWHPRPALRAAPGARSWRAR